jgi:Tfp pilus assembly PilM family ATPase
VSSDSKANSTEELLQIIRGNDESTSVPGPPAASGNGGSAPTPSGKSKSGGGLFSFNKRVVLGVEVGNEAIDLVRVSSTDTHFRGAGVRRIPIPTGIRPGSDEFVALLGDSITSICGRGALPEIWTTIRTPDVDVGPVLIPRVSSSKVSDTVYWTIKKEKKFDEKNYVFDIRPWGVVKDEGVNKLEVLTAMGRRDRVAELDDWFRRAGFRLAGVTTISAAMQNFYARGLAPETDGLAGLIHVSNEFSAIAIFEGSRLMFSRTIKSGVDSMAETLQQRLTSNGGGLTTNLDEVRTVLLDRFEGRPANEEAFGAGLPDEELFDIITPALLRLARQADRTLEYYFNNFKQRCSVLHLSGELFSSDRVCEYMAAQLGLPAVPVRVLPESARLGEDVREGRLAFNAAAALAMSESGQTINLLVNHEQRAKIRFWQRINDAVSVAGLVLALIVGGLFGWQKIDENAKKAELDKLNVRYAQIDPKVTRKDLSTIAASIVKDHGRLRQLSEQYEALAVLAELARYTPPGIRFLNISIDQQVMSEAQAEGVVTKSSAAPVGVVVLDGVVLLSGEDYNTTLSRFLIKLESSPIFEKYQILSSEVTELSPEGEVLHFILHVSLV